MCTKGRRHSDKRSGRGGFLPRPIPPKLGQPRGLPTGSRQHPILESLEKLPTHAKGSGMSIGSNPPPTQDTELSPHGTPTGPHQVPRAAWFALGVMGAGFVAGDALSTGLLFISLTPGRNRFDLFSMVEGLIAATVVSVLLLWSSRPRASVVAVSFLLALTSFLAAATIRPTARAAELVYGVQCNEEEPLRTEVACLRLGRLRPLLGGASTRVILTRLCLGASERYQEDACNKLAWYQDDESCGLVISRCREQGLPAKVCAGWEGGCKNRAPARQQGRPAEAPPASLPKAR
jgi:hypothetical protein